MHAESSDVLGTRTLPFGEVGTTFILTYTTLQVQVVHAESGEVLGTRTLPFGEVVTALQSAQYANTLLLMCTPTQVQARHAESGEVLSARTLPFGEVVTTLQSHTQFTNAFSPFVHPPRSKLCTLRVVRFWAHTPCLLVRS